MTTDQDEHRELTNAAGALSDDIVVRELADLRDEFVELSDRATERARGLAEANANLRQMLGGFTFKEFSKLALRTWRAPLRSTAEGFAYLGHGLASEAGEVSAVLKRMLRDEMPLGAARALLRDEIGDVLWYLNALAFEAGLTLDECAKANNAKLADRDRRNVIRGSGGDR